MKIFTLTAFLIFLAIVNASAATKIVNKTECVLQLFNQNNNNAPLALALNPASEPPYPSHTVEEKGIKVNIGSYSTWDCDNYITTYYMLGLKDECVEVYTSLFPTVPGESSVPGELAVRACPAPEAPSKAPPAPK